MKRLFDFIVALILFVALSPLLLVIALIVRWNLGSPILYSQLRPGLNEKTFRLYKFRTMRDAKGADGKNLPDADRLTKVGLVLRSCSLDELPELWNVVRGDMSLVGPRPLLIQYLPLYSSVQRRRHNVRPGITGWAQINGRNALAWEQRFELDVWYVANRTFWLDMKILLVTVVRVVSRDGISARGEATMSIFKGSRDSTGS